jgi:hypothetical protein
MFLMVSLDRSSRPIRKLPLQRSIVFCLIERLAVKFLREHVEVIRYGRFNFFSGPSV